MNVNIIRNRTFLGRFFATQWQWFPTMSTTSYSGIYRSHNQRGLFSREFKYASYNSWHAECSRWKCYCWFFDMFQVLCFIVLFVFVDWLIDLIDWLIGWLILLIDWLIDWWLIDWLIDWLIGLYVYASIQLL